jgi:hypothetical protein
VIPNLFENSDVFEIDLSNISSFYRRNEIWQILFYDPSKQESKDKADEFKMLAEKLYGIIKIGAINCHDEEELCEEFGVFTYPTIYTFTEKYNDDGEKYQGKFEWKEISQVATAKMQNFVQIVNMDNYQDFITKDPTKHKIITLTERKSTSPIFKSLSKQYKDKLVFGEVKDKELQAMFKDYKVPSIIALTDP